MDGGWLKDCGCSSFQIVADELLRVQLNTMDEERVVAFEYDPCAMEERYASVEHEGAQYFRYLRSTETRCPSLFRSLEVIDHAWWIL